MTDIPPKVDTAEEEDPIVPESSGNVDDDMAAIFKEVGSPTEKEEPKDDSLNKVKTSASRLVASFGLLTKDIDSKLGISDTAKKIDERIHVTDRTKQAFGAVTATATTLDQKFHVSETTRSTASAVSSNSAFLGIKSSVGGVLEGAGNGLKKFDDKHKLTSKTADLVSSTADFLTNKINPKTTSKVTTPDLDILNDLQDGENEKSSTPEENYPSSFQKE